MIIFYFIRSIKLINLKIQHKNLTNPQLKIFLITVTYIAIPPPHLYLNKPFQFNKYFYRYYFFHHLLKPSEMITFYLQFAQKIAHPNYF